MNFEPILSHEAAKTLLRADVKFRARLQRRIHELANDPFDSRLSAQLTGRPGIRKSRVGGWRILYSVDIERPKLHVAAIDTRGQVYKR